MAKSARCALKKCFPATWWFSMTRSSTSWRKSRSRYPKYFAKSEYRKPRRTKRSWAFFFSRGSSGRLCGRPCTPVKVSSSEGYESRSASSRLSLNSGYSIRRVARATARDFHFEANDAMRLDIAGKRTFQSENASSDWMAERTSSLSNHFKSRALLVLKRVFQERAANDALDSRFARSEAYFEKVAKASKANSGTEALSSSRAFSFANGGAYLP